MSSARTVNHVENWDLWQVCKNKKNVLCLNVNNVNRCRCVYRYVKWNILMNWIYVCSCYCKMLEDLTFLDMVSFVGSQLSFSQKKLWDFVRSFRSKHYDYSGSTLKLGSPKDNNIPKSNNTNVSLSFNSLLMSLLSQLQLFHSDIKTVSPISLSYSFRLWFCRFTRNS